VFSLMAIMSTERIGSPGSKTVLDTLVNVVITDTPIQLNYRAEAPHRPNRN
jgi:hypothetical protein